MTYLTTQDPIMEDVWKAYQTFQQDKALMDQNIAYVFDASLYCTRQTAAYRSKAYSGTGYKLLK